MIVGNLVGHGNWLEVMTKLGEAKTQEFNSTEMLVWFRIMSKRPHDGHAIHVTHPEHSTCYSGVAFQS